MEKLLEALKLIKDLCDKNNDCEKCPLYLKDSCCVQDAPNAWKLKTKEEISLIKLFKEEE